ncbi:baseplate J/gp47 family protein [Pelosinus baikalensis]|uniref:Baseplate J/gp47 family protein n=1 Tax=Pelosinus baikalensis TaxID=2892015 RepID=A0ABS8HZM0_9FIRM|nr:baseplate J/gp47 family protein [Pelosinus baikalensis]MCC5468622.1 baseplate J/gp47 family protein [Pelosinus baikalensis]
MARRYTDRTSEKIMQGKLGRVPNMLDKREGSIIYDAMAPNSIEEAKLYTELDNVLERGFVDTATDEDLELRTKEQGVERKPAAKTIRFLQCTETSGRIFIGDRFLIDTVYFKATKQIDIPGVVAIESETAGSQTVVDYNAEVLSVEGIPGLEGASLVFEHAEDFNGVDAESDEDLRERYYITVRRNPGSGNIADYEYWCSEITGVGKVIVQPLWNGGGTVKVTVLDSNGDPASPGLVTDVKEYLDPVDGLGMGKAPIGAHVTVEPAVAIAIDIVASIRLNGSKSLADVQAEFANDVESYFTSINLSSNRTVILNMIGSVMVNVSGVIDYDNLTLNGVSENIILGVNEIPALGTVTLSEV